MSSVPIHQALQIAIQHLNAGRLVETEAISRKVLAQNPSNYDAMHLLGSVAYQVGKYDAAIEILTQAVALKPDSPDLFGNLGWAYLAANRFSQALAQADAALRLDANFAKAYALRAAALFHQGQFELSLQSTQRLLELVPTDAGAFANAAVALERLGRLDEAVAMAQRAITLNPNNAQAHDNLGAALTKLGRTPEGKESHRRAIALQPELVSAWNNLAYCAYELGDVVEAEAAARRATQLAPNNPLPYRTLGAALQEIGRLDEASEAFDKAIALLSAACEGRRALNEDSAVECDQLARAKLLAATMLPPIYESVEDIERWRQRLVGRVKQLQSEKFELELGDEPAPSLFLLAYQGKNDIDIQRDIARLVVAPEVPPLAPRNPGKIRISFVSRFLRNHTIGRLNAGVIENLNRDEFEVSVVSIGRYGDAVAAHLQERVKHYLSAPPSLKEARRMIAEEDPDIVFFTDIGMEPVTYSLAHYRMAPVQCVTWGHPLTTGIDTVDYFISSELLDIPEAQEHYTETLVRLPSLVVYYERPVLPKARKTRKDFGIDENANLYGCLQAVWKLHPEFDELIAEILRRDPRGRFLLLSTNTPRWQETLMKRFERTLGEGAKRVQFIPQQKHPDFLTLTSLCDVMLDPIHFGGGNTSYESFAFGVPIVTLPSQFLRGRITAGQYKMMGLDDCIATSRQDYIERAVAIGTDRDRRRTVSDKILASNSVLYENMQGVRDLEAFFRQVGVSA